MIAPTIPEQLEALRDVAADQRREAADSALLNTTREKAARRAQVLTYVADRIEVFANKAAAKRAEPSA